MDERIITKEELKEEIKNLKEGQILSIDFRGEGYKEPELDEAVPYESDMQIPDDPTEGDEGYDDKENYNEK